MTEECMDCGRKRDAEDEDYNPMQVAFGAEPGWYSGDDGEICGGCMAELIGRANQ